MNKCGVGAGMLDAERSFGRARGHKDMSRSPPLAARSHP